MTKKSVKITIDSKLLEWVDDQVIGTVIVNRSQAIELMLLTFQSAFLNITTTWRCPTGETIKIGQVK